MLIPTSLEELAYFAWTGMFIGGLVLSFTAPRRRPNVGLLFLAGSTLLPVVMVAVFGR